MSNLIVLKEEVDGITTVPATLIQDAVTDGKESIAIIKSAAPELAELPKIELLTNAVAQVLEVIPEEEGKLALATDVFEDLNAKVINFLANQIHDAAMTLIGAVGQIKACKVSGIEPEEATTVYNYCVGVLPKVSNATVMKVVPKKMKIGGEMVFIQYPQLIEHKLGVHRTRVSPKSTNGSTELGVEYRESGPSYKDSHNRMKGVTGRLVEEGFKCEDKYPNLYCHGELDKGKLNQLATFFSLLIDADIAGMGGNTVGVVRDKVWEKAGELNSKFGGNAWESGQGKLSWSSLQKEWIEEKDIYEKKPIYEDLRELAILRDGHHEIEAKYGIDSGSETEEGATAIIENAIAALSLCLKNKYPTKGLKEQINHLEGKVKAGNLAGLLSDSDAIGHTIHIILDNQLVKIGLYAGCSVSGDISNINTGNLGYCEGTLKGTSVSFSKAGNMMTHTVAPNVYKTFILDENPDGSYRLTITLPGEGALAGEIALFLEHNKGFELYPSGGITKCEGSTKDTGEIRELALLFSNLKGASDAIGGDCAAKAVELAYEAAKEQNKKGMFAFINEPIMANAKDWINSCHKQYGIMPPGLTEEEKETLKLIGTEKTYGGCSFVNTDTIPNKGILVYCQGVRKNPIADINAFLTPDGQLNHYFHATTDRLAVINTIPLGEGSYQLEINNIDMRGDALQDASIEMLKKSGFTCPSNTECHREVSPDSLRITAEFLSSLHHIYKVPSSCVTPALAYVGEQVSKLPESIEAHESIVYPFTAGQWDKEVCSKLPGAPVAPTPPKKKEILGVEEIGWIGYGPVPKPPFKVGGCTSMIKAKPTKAKFKYCSGVVDKFGKAELPFAAAVATLTPKENKHWVGGGIYVLFDSKWSQLIVTLPDEWVKIPAIGKTLKEKFHAHQLSPKVFSTYDYMYLLARFFSCLSNIHMLPEWCHEAAVKYAYETQHIYKLATIYPYTVSEWKKEICTPLKPEKLTTYASCSPEAKKKVDNKIKGFLKEGLDPSTVKTIIIKQFGISDAGLDAVIDTIAKSMKPLKGKSYEELSLSEIMQVNTAIEHKVGEDKLLPQILGELNEEFGLVESPGLADKIIDEIEAANKKLSMFDLPQFEIDEIYAKVCEYKDFGYVYEEIIEKIYADYPIKENQQSLEWLHELWKSCPQPKVKGKPKLSPPKLQEAILYYLQLSPEEKAPYENMEEAILEQYDVSPGPSMQEGTITHELDELISKDKVAYYGGTTYGLTKIPEKPFVTKVAEAINLIKSGKSYAGCHPIPPEGTELSAPQILYCQGVQTPHGKTQAAFVNTIEDPETGEKVPTVSQYGDGYNVIVTSPSPDSLALAFKETEPKGKEWKTRQEIVAKLLAGDGFSCSFLDDHFVCNRSGLDVKDTVAENFIRTTAIFLSKLHNVDKLPLTCIKPAIEYAGKSAWDINCKMGEDAHLLETYPYDISEWNLQVCDKIEAKDAGEKSIKKAKEIGTVELLSLAYEHNIDPGGSDAALALKLINAGVIDP